MTNFINVGVKRTDNGEPITNKKLLKALVKEDPYFVTAYPTSNMGTQFSGPLNKLPMGNNLVVTGPDPYTDRRWHANIIRTVRDEVRVS